MKMMTLVGVSTLALAILAPAGLIADEHEKQEETYIYATYFYCNTSKEEKADEFVAKHSAPIYDAAVADGTINAWGWLRHHTGGKWRRIQYHTSNTVEGLLSAQETIGKRMDEAMGDSDEDMSRYCSGHDDYIWQGKAGGDGTAERGKVGISVYYVCSMAEEDRIDELFLKVTKPWLEKAASEGKLTSWGWNSHVFGGKYRRLETMTGPDFPTLLKARAEIIAGIYGDEGNPDAAEFDKLCSSHSDYMWEIVHEKSGS
jgi:hypothetical protein